MPITPRYKPEADLNALPGVRNTARVEALDYSQAAGSFARFAQQRGEEIHQREDEAAVMAAAAKVNEYEYSTFDPSNAEGVGAYGGLKAPPAVEGFMAKRDEAASAARMGLTARQQRAFDALDLRQRDQYRGRLATWSAGQHEHGMKAKEAAITESFFNTGISAGVSGDIAGAEENLGKAMSATYLQTLRSTGSEEAARAAETKLASDFHYSTALGLAKRNSGITAARDYVDKHGDSIEPARRAQLDEMIQPTLQDWRDEDDAAVYVDGGDFPGEPGGNAQAIVAGNLPQEPKAVQAMYDDMAAQFGTVKTSGIRPVLNKGAKERSQHPHGFAADFRVRGVPLDKQEALIAHARSRGLEVIDERNGPEPHIHIEYPGKIGTSMPTKGSSGSIAKATDEQDAIRRMKQREPRERWDALTTKISRIYDERRRAKAQMHGDALDGMRLAIEDKADGTRSWREAVGPDMARLAIEQGWDSALDSAWRQKRGEAVVESDPVAVEMYDRMMLYTPDTFAAPETKVKILSDMARLSVGDRARLMKAWSDANDPAKRDGAKLDWAAEGERVKLGLDRLGIDTSERAKDTAKAEAGAFRAAYRQAEEAFIRTYGKKPIGAEADKLLTNVVRNFAEARRAGTTSKYGSADRYGHTLSRKVSAGDFNTAKAALERAGKPTDDESVIAYIESYYATHAD